ncbi:hypothetical protein PCE1_000439 [Barthelona sp. PCE]
MSKAQLKNTPLSTNIRTEGSFLAKSVSFLRLSFPRLASFASGLDGLAVNVDVEKDPYLAALNVDDDADQIADSFKTTGAGPNVQSFRATASINSTAVNLANSMIGAGLLSFSLFLRLAGLVTGALIMMGLALLSRFTLTLLIRCCVLTRRYDIKGILKKSFPTGIAKIVDFLVGFYGFLFLIAYLLIFGSYLPELLQTWTGNDTSFYFQAWFLKLIALVFVLIPLCMLEDLNALRFASAGALVAILYTVFTVFARTLELASLDNIKIIKIDFELMDAIPLCIFAFSAHLLIGNLYKELRHRSVPRMVKSINIALSINFCFYFLIGVCGYLCFGDETPDNVLMGFDSDDFLIQTAKLAMCFVVLSSYPILHYASNVAFSSLLPEFKNRRVYLAIFLTSLSYVVTLFVDSLGLILSFTGAAVSTFIVYILPGFAFLKFSQRKKNSEKFKSLRTKSIMVIIFGFFVSIFSITRLIIKNF